MIVEAVGAAGGLWALRWLMHFAILRALRAPRLLHAQGPADLGFTPDVAREVRVSGPRGKQLFGWLVSPARPAHAAQQPVPAVLVMHGWGANAAMTWPVVRPLHAAGFAVLLIDARCHGLSDDETPLPSMSRFAENTAARLASLRAEPTLIGRARVRSGSAASRLATIADGSKPTPARGSSSRWLPRRRSVALYSSSSERSIHAVCSCTVRRCVNRSAVGSSLAASANGKMLRAVRATAS